MIYFPWFYVHQIAYNCRFRHSKQFLWIKTIITDNYLLLNPDEISIEK